MRPVYIFSSIKVSMGGMWVGVKMPCALRLFIFEAITFILYLLITQFGESGKNIIQALLHVIVASILLLHKSIQSAPNAIDLHSSSILLPFCKTINLSLPPPRLRN